MSLEIKITHQEIVDFSTNPALLDTVACPDWARGKVKAVASKLASLDVGNGVKIKANFLSGWLPIPYPWM